MTTSESQDWDTDWLNQALYSEGPTEGLEKVDPRRHGRSKLLLQLRDLIQDSWPEGRGEYEDGSLVILDYPGRQWEWEVALMDSYQLNKTEGLTNALDSSPRQANLKYVEGIKYTLGGDYRSREEDGVFIFLSLVLPAEEEELMARDNYVQLECKDGYFWASSIVEETSCSSTPIVIFNGPLEPTEDSAASSFSCIKRKLRFSDIISIAFGGWGKEGSHCDLIFKPSPSVEEKEEDKWVQEVRNNPLEIPLIVSTILSSLPTADVKGLRLVSQLWNHEGLKRIAHDVTLSIFKEAINRRGCCVTTVASNVIKSTDSDILMEISSLAHSPMMSSHKAKFPRWTVTIPHLRGSEIESYDDEELATMLEKKIRDDLAWFLSPPLSYVRTLCLQGIIGLKPNLEPFGLVVSKLAQSLVTLELRVTPASPSSRGILDSEDIMREIRILQRNFAAGLEEGSLASIPTETMTQLKTIVISVCAASFFPFLFKLFHRRGVPNLESFHLLYCPDHDLVSSISSIVGLSVLKTSSPIGQNPSEEEVNHLTEVAIGAFPCPRDEIRMDTLPITLRKLKLMNVLQYHDTSQIIAALERVQNNLEELTLHYSRVVQWMYLIFPRRMQSLTNLSVFVNFSRFCFEESARTATVQFEFVPSAWDPRDRVENYATHFPSLKTLVIWPVEEVKHQDESLDPVRNAETATWKVFLPLLKGFISVPPTSPAVSVVNLDIPFLLKGMLYHGALDDLEASFPSVCFPPELEDARTMDVENWPEFSSEDEDEEEESSSSSEDEEEG